ncbi:hypothetical protein EOP99_24205, partial [Escherichia coli]|nr:hypothetical protein [Escherichia coli]
GRTYASRRNAPVIYNLLLIINATILGSHRFREKKVSLQAETTHNIDMRKIFCYTKKHMK